jgi:spore maturation protein CgeB
MKDRGKTDFLLLQEDYQESYTRLFENNIQLNSLSYQETAAHLFSEFIYYGDSYLRAFAELNLYAEQIIPGCVPLQLKWAREQRFHTPGKWTSRRPFRWWWTVFKQTLPPRDRIGFSIATEQIKRLRPDTLWVFSGIPVTQVLLDQWRRYTRKMILWWSCPIVPGFPFRSFDLVLSGIPSMVKYFQNQGIKAHYLAHAFDSRVLRYVTPSRQKIRRVLFAGSLNEGHSERIEYFNRLSLEIEIDFYGNGPNRLTTKHFSRIKIQPPVWGKELYALLGSYLIVLHYNVDVAGNEASAKRLFEATGMGACVVTQQAENLKDFFEPGQEIVTYSTAEECIDKVKFLLSNPEIAVRIGKKAQARTLAQHLYPGRVRQLLSHLSSFA